MGAMSPRDRRRIACAAVASLLAFPAWGLERLQRKFDLERGLPFSEVNAIAQDTTGFLWITAGGGLFRYDGVALRAWAKEPVRPYLKSVATGPAGEVFVREGPGDSGRLYRVDGDGIRLVEGPSAQPLVISGLPIWDRASNVWVTTGDTVWMRSAAGAWQEWPAARFDSERPRLLLASDDGDAIVCTDKAIWRVDASAGVRRLAPVVAAQKVLVGADGKIVALTFGREGGRVTEINDGREREIFNLPARPIDMVRQGRNLWVAYDSCLVALRPDEPPEILGPGEGVHGGGPLLIDREGSLWVASFRGLLQYPAPETAAWLADRATRRLAFGPDGIWVDSWGGLSLLRPHGASWRVEAVPETGTSAVCVTNDGTLWSGYVGRFLERRDGRFITHSEPRLTYVNSCAPGGEGRVWLATNLGLTLGPLLRAGPRGFVRQDTRVTLLEDAAAQLWMAASDEVCHADARDVASGRAASWSCSKIDGAGTITSLAEASPGRLWAGTSIGGVYRLTPGDRWEPIAGSRKLPTLLVRKLRPSPSGGVWMLSFGTIVRAVERTDAAEGWEIVESPAPWHGLMISDAEDLLEVAGGDLWITTLAGVVHVPAGVRRAVPPVPRVELVDALVDGKALAPQESIRLPYSRNRIELRFAALSYRDPAKLRYQVRLRRDAPWLDASSRPSFQFVDLPPGTYQPEVRASLDGTRWSEAPARLSFAVLPPYWRTWWFAAGLAALLLAGIYGVYRVRLTRLLALERVRTDIATDLHDDIGASLSRTAILAEVVRRDVATANPTAAERLDQIARSAREVVDGMADVVWSLDPGSDEFGELVARVRAFASAVLPASGVAFSVDGPDAAATLAAKVGAEPRRQVYLVIKEAISNVARHAHAKNASISLALAAGTIEVRVSDDGRGFSAGAAGASPSFGGNGLRNMKARVSRCHGVFELDSRPGHGTRIALRVPIGHA